MPSSALSRFPGLRYRGAYASTADTELSIRTQHAMAPDMELQNLSSNWKKLQETLKKDTSKPPKRKYREEILQPQRNGIKRQKFQPKSKIKVGSMKETEKGLMTMGNGWSKTAKKAATSASLALWAEDNDIPAKDLAEAYGTSLKSTSIPNGQKTEDKINEGLSSTAEAGKYIAIDCEMVGVGPNPDAESALARVSMVNYHGDQLYDSFVQPKEAVTDYRTHVSGITPQLLQSARTFEIVTADVAKLLDNRILVGHAVRHDLDALLLSHSKRDIRDTSKHAPFRRLAAGRTPGLKRLAREVLGVDIQRGEHSSIEDARATMLLFRRNKDDFEREHISKWGSDWRTGDASKEGEAKVRKLKKRQKAGK